MEKENLLEYVAPCGLLCYACISFKDGPCSQGARDVYTYTDGWDEFYSANLPKRKRKKYQKESNAYRNTLQFLGGASCPGCRNHPPSNKGGWGCREGCAIQACVKERGVDFCAQCDAFPCDKLDQHCADSNRRIQEIGLEAYFEEKKQTSIYARWKKKAE